MMIISYLPHLSNDASRTWSVVDGAGRSYFLTLTTSSNSWTIMHKHERDALTTRNGIRRGNWMIEVTKLYDCCYAVGFDDRARGTPIEMNPHPSGTTLYAGWRDGWLAAKAGNIAAPKQKE